MRFPLSFLDISLALALVTFVLLVTFKTVSPYMGPTNLVIEKKLLKNIALVSGLVFFFTVLVRILQILFAA